MSWVAEPMLAFDTETTGVDPTEACIVTATAVRIVGAKTATKTWLLDPGVPIPEAAAAIHGVTTETARATGQAAFQGLREIALSVAGAMREGVPVVGHNVVYDLTVLDHDLRRHQLPPLDEWVSGPIRPVIDSLCLDKHYDRYRKGKRTLTATCAHYRVALDGAHDATADALGSARILWRMGRLYPALAAMSLDELHDAQVGWYREQAEGLAAYFAKQGKPEVVSTDWPIRPCVTEVTV